MECPFCLIFDFVCLSVWEPGSRCKCAHSRTIINQGDLQSKENLYKYLIKTRTVILSLSLSLFVAVTFGILRQFVGARQVN